MDPDTRLMGSHGRILGGEIEPFKKVPEPPPTHPLQCTKGFHLDATGYMTSAETLGVDTSLKSRFVGI